MKKLAIIGVAAAAMFCSSCNGDKCKCTVTYPNGDETTKTVTRPENGKCKDLESDGKGSILGIDINLNTTVKCKTISE